MLSITNLSFYFGSRAIYEDLSFHIKPKDRIGLIGANGKGKSTLLKLIAGNHTPDKGDISKAKDCSIGFLNQDLLSYETHESTLTVAMQAFEVENELMNGINSLLKKLETDYSDDLIDKLTKKQEQFAALDGYSLQSKAESILEGLGFSTADLSKPLQTFSGGWRMRVMLAKILLANPALLLLDEPTNHLDLPSIEWMESYLKNYEGAYIVVSHDQEFLNRTVTTIAEVSQSNIAIYKGNYDFYITERELRHEIQHNAFINQQKKIKDTEKFINRFKAKASKARQVQSKIKNLDKVEKIEDVVEENATISFKFNFNKPSGKIISEIKNVSKSYGDNVILKNASGIISRGDKIVLIGANGKGKSTLMRLIAGAEGQQEGTVVEGHNVIKAFYAQHQLESLTPDAEILEELKQSGAEKTELELRAILGCFLFSDDDVFKKIKVLSGGEKSRVALAKTLISEANFLLLDEPTNHLDIQSVNMLIQALDSYEGSFIAISHNRYFISNIANKIWFIEDHEIKEYPGTYTEYLDWQEKRKAQQITETPKKSIVEKKKKELTFSEEDELKKELKKKNNQLQKVEDEIHLNTQKKQQIEEEMSKESVYTNVDLLQEKTTAFEKVNQSLETLNTEWESIALEIEELETKLG